MCRKLSFLIGVVVILAALNSAFAQQELKVDLALLKPGSGGEIDEGTAKEGWIIWAWTDDEEFHDLQKYENLGGTGIEVRLSLSREGKGALGKSIDGAEPICNTFYHDFDYDAGDVLLGFYNIPAGQYELFGYHRDPQGLNDMPSIDVNCVNVGDKWGGDPNCAIDNPGAVVQIHDGETIDVNVGIPGDQIYDDNLPYSLVKFYTNGTDVLVRYRSANKSAVLNAFILVVPSGNLAGNPSPGHNADFVCPDADLVWTAGQLVADTNGHNLYFGTDLRDELLMFEDGFEGGDANWAPSNWTIYDANEDANSHSGRYSATAGTGSGTMTTVDINASEVGSMRVELWVRKTDGIEDGDVNLYY